MSYVPDLTVELEELTGTAGGRAPSRVANPALWSVLAIAVAVAANLWWAEVAGPYELLLWTPVIVPAFLLVYRWSWHGAAVAVGAGTTALLAVEVVLMSVSGLPVHWGTMGIMVIVLALVAAGSALVVENLRRRATEAVRLAFLDSLTGLPNRRVLDLFLSHAVARARRGMQLSVVTFDLDGFRQVNEAGGREAGDRVLQQTGEILARTTRSADIAGRLQSDYFVVILAGERSVGAFYCAERVRREFGQAPFARELGLTVSCGIASYEPAMAEARELLEASDRALRAAKGRGGDVVVLNDAGFARQESAETASVLYLDDTGALREATPHRSAEPTAD